MINEWPAHIRILSDGSRVCQSVREHNSGTASIAGRCLKQVGLGSVAKMAGNEHDDGKFTAAYRNYLNDAVDGKPVVRGSVIHTFTGVRLILEKFHENQADSFDKLTAELIAYAIGAHHGLFDIVDKDGASGFAHRLHYPDEPYNEALQNWLDDGNTEEGLKESFQAASQEVRDIVCKLTKQFFTPPKGTKSTSEHDDELNFYFAMLARLLLSAVVDGDRTDTGRFMEGLDRPPPPEDRSQLWQTCLLHVEQKLDQIQSGAAAKQPITQARRKISTLCAEKAQGERGVFRLNVPTGAGKTLSSLRFALAHAQKWNCEHIIIATPLLSILEQNAATIRQFVGHDEWILEHHSNVIREMEDTEQASARELLEENWSAPIILTTLVQLLNTLFSYKTSSVRRFHSLCNSVIIIDEVQTVPLKLLSLFNLVVNFLAAVCGTTIVLCSATQPCLETVTHPIQVPIQDMVPYSESLWRPFVRTELIDGGRRKLEQLPPMVENIMEGVNSLLIVCNKREQARTLLDTLKEEPWECLHLSAAMCPAHRTKVVERMQEVLKGIRQGSGKKLLCVSTQVIEAGVDISFEGVIRLMAGMDSAVQAAGRCNRNGESESIRPVYLVNCTDEKLDRLREIQWAKTASSELMDDFQKNPGKFQGDLSAEAAIREYYSVLYRNLPGKYQDFCTDKGSVLQKLSRNRAPENPEEDHFILHQAFLTAGKQFQVFDENTEAALVPYGDGKELILELNSARAQNDLTYTKRLLEKAKPYFINLYAYQIDLLEKRNALYMDKWKRVRILKEGCYREDIGFSLDNPENQFLEV